MRKRLIILGWVWTNDEMCTRVLWSHSCLDSHPSHLCVQVSFSEQSMHEIAFLSLQNMAGRQGDIYLDPGIEKLSGVHHFRQWGYVYAIKLNSAQKQSQALECNCLYSSLSEGSQACFRSLPCSIPQTIPGHGLGTFPWLFPAGTLCVQVLCFAGWKSLLE